MVVADNQNFCHQFRLLFYKIAWKLRKTKEFAKSEVFVFFHALREDFSAESLKLRLFTFSFAVNAALDESTN